MGVRAKLSQTSLEAFVQVHVTDELEGHFLKGVSRPAHEPVHGGVVDEGRVHSAVVSEGVSDGAHADTQVQVVLDVVEEELVHQVRGLDRVTGLLEGAADLFTDLAELFVGVEVGDHTRVEHVLDVLKEALLHDVVIREDKDCLELVLALVGSHFVHGLQEFSEVFEVEALGHFQLENVHRRDEGGQSCQGVATGATDTHQEGVTSLEVDDSVDLSDVDNGILEQDEVHLDQLGLHVILSELVVQVLSELGEVSDLLVHLHVLVHEIHEDGVFTIGAAVLGVVHLEHGLQLFAQVALELVTVLE
mmetsp:Transcript_20737/g.31919  ORF Transcript_20737/g.31919 Transcript_20737/m.31919 type:complete len:304 (+) Transcript_20737:4515-5426(+)